MSVLGTSLFTPRTPHEVRRSLTALARPRFAGRLLDLLWADIRVERQRSALFPNHVGVEELGFAHQSIALAVEAVEKRECLVCGFAFQNVQ